MTANSTFVKNDCAIDPNFGKVYGKTVVAVAPQYTSQDCSSCGNRVQKSLSVRTHFCSCGTVLDRDRNAALNILGIAD
jgi:putative transposase